jgi:outer membrane protein assembly factor BamA
MKRFLLLFICIGYSIGLSAQLSYVVIEEINLVGNLKTKDQVLFREMTVQVGDTIALDALPTRLSRSESLLMNTALFSRVSITYQDWKATNNHITLRVQVDESWYIYPVPGFQLADRNFNVWWVDHNASLRRTNIGLDFTHLNLTGRGDRLKFSFQLGYTQKYRLHYNTRALNKAQTLGLTTSFSYSQNREVNYATVKNRQVFYDNNENINYHRFQGDLTFAYRPALLERHDFRLGFRQNQITEKIAQDLNPSFFLNGKNSQRYVILEYFYSYDNRDNRGYPMAGNYYSASLEKDGLGLYNDRNALTSLFQYHLYQNIGSKINLGLVSKLKYSIIRTQQPYNDNRAIGFSGNALRGYEYYVIDGLDMLLLNTHLKYPIINREVNIGRLMPIQAFRRIPIRVNLSVHNDFGYVNNPYEKAVNPFNNRLLWGTGLGIDSIFFFDFVLRVEYSFNHLGESGLFLHFNSSL